MTYKIQRKEYSVHVLTFDSEIEFKEWEEEGSCISDLHSSQISLSNCDIIINEFMNDAWTFQESQSLELLSTKGSHGVRVVTMMRSDSM